MIEHHLAEGGQDLATECSRLENKFAIKIFVDLRIVKEVKSKENGVKCTE